MEGDKGALESGKRDTGMLLPASVAGWSARQKQLTASISLLPDVLAGWLSSHTLPYPPSRPPPLPP